MVAPQGPGLRSRAAFAGNSEGAGSQCKEETLRRPVSDNSAREDVLLAAHDLETVRRKRPATRQQASCPSETVRTKHRENIAVVVQAHVVVASLIPDKC